jgi:ribosomal protein L32
MSQSKLTALVSQAFGGVNRKRSMSSTVFKCKECGATARKNDVCGNCGYLNGS